MSKDQLQSAPSDATLMLASSPYLGAWDFGTEEAVLTVRDVKQVKLEARPGIPNEGAKPIVFFEEHDKGLICGATNLKALLKRFGSKDWRNVWVGKTVTVYATTCKGKGGGTVDCVRVRDTAPTKPSSGRMPERQMDPEMRKRQMLEAGELIPASEIVRQYQEAPAAIDVDSIKRNWALYSKDEKATINAARTNHSKQAGQREPGADDQ